MPAHIVSANVQHTVLLRLNSHGSGWFSQKKDLSNKTSKMELDSWGRFGFWLFWNELGLWSF